MDTEYLVVDLEIKHRGQFEELLAEFDRYGCLAEAYRVNKTVWSTNLGAPRARRNPDQCITDFCRFIKTLKGKARKQWNRAHHKNFNIGYDVSDSHWAYQSGLSIKTVQAIAAVGAGVSITLYPIKES